MDYYCNKTEQLKKEIYKKYHSIRAFAKDCGVPHGTIVSALNKGIGGTSFANVVKMCNCLGIDCNEFNPIIVEVEAKRKCQNLDTYGDKICELINDNKTFLGRNGKYVNPDNESFREVINSEIYVDKTLLISETNRRLSTMDKYICVSRPRRFGKSVTANMLAAYYSMGCDSSDVFRNCDISKDSLYRTHLNKYNVIKINIQDFYTRKKNVVELIDYIQDRIICDLKNLYPDLVESTEYLDDVIEDIYSKTKVKFVLIIDEWDCLLRVDGRNTNNLKLYFDFLRYLIKDRAYFALVYLTGILPIKKYGEHSALNMFCEYSMIDAGDFAEFTAFTEPEVMQLCAKYGRDFEEIKSWYDGYYLTGVGHLYSPKSVVESIHRNRCGNYWTQTETYEALKIYIEMDFDGLKESIVRMMAGEKVQIATRRFQNDMTSLSSQEDVLTLLVHLGYLAYDGESSSVTIPNYEILDEYANAIEGAKWDEIVNSIKQSQKLLEHTWEMDCEEVAKAIEKTHMEYTSILQYNDEKTMTGILSIAYYSAINYYTRVYEMPSGKGYADIAFLPRKGVNKPALVVELKYDKAASGAISQIKEKQYAEKLIDYCGDVLLIGINYNKKTKRHDCLIEKINV